MNQWKLTILACLFAGLTHAQNTQDLRETARSFQRQGDYENAILVLNKASNQEPENLELKKELAIAYYVARQFGKAKSLITPLVERADADEQTYHIAALIHRTSDDMKEAERLYKLALKKFPKSGILHSEYGEFLEFKEPAVGSSLAIWEKGIEVDPDFSGNYFHAAKKYAHQSKPLWALLYGELFVNLESYTVRTTEIKTLMLDALKRMFVNGIDPQTGRNGFEKAVLEGLARQNSLTGNGITPESITAIRTRFILGWQGENQQKFPYKLFEYHRQLLQDGLFESYNQWLFGSAANMAAYQSWTTNRANEYAEFTRYQQNRLFKVPAGQYYNKP